MLITSHVVRVVFVSVVFNVDESAKVQRTLATLVIGAISSLPVLTRFLLSVLYHLEPGQKVTAFGHRIVAVEWR